MNDRSKQTAWEVFRWPAVISVLTGVGLVSALLGSGIADALSWLLLGSIPTVIIVAWLR